MIKFNFSDLLKSLRYEHLVIKISSLWERLVKIGSRGCREGECVFYYS